MKVTDSEGYTASSPITVMSVSDGEAVDGYSVSSARHLPVLVLATYFVVVASAALGFCLVRRKTK